MNKVYILHYETYEYDDNCFNHYTTAFRTLEGAQQYFDLVRDKIIDDYLRASHCETLEDFSDEYYLDEDESYLKIEMDHSSYDELWIQEADLLDFNVDILDFEFAGNNVNLDVLENNYSLISNKKILIFSKKSILPKCMKRA